jgi:glyceraldehyde 3-phosphate dehydrogenase
LIMPKFGLIGFGRIGRGVVRALYERGWTDDLAMVTEVNPCGRDPEELVANLAYLLACDSLAGPFPVPVSAQGRSLLLDGREIPVVLGKPPGEVDWSLHGVRLLLEASGDDSSVRAAASLAGAAVEKVIITHSESCAHATLVKGVNLESYDPDSHHVISCSTCTANAAAPVLTVLDDAFGVEQGSFLSVHPALSGDTLLDGPDKDFTAGRSGLSVRPVPSEMAKTIAQVIPHMEGRLASMSLRVPTTIVNALYADLLLARIPASLEEVVGVLEKEASDKLAGILTLERGIMGHSRPVADFAGNPHSSVLDLNWLALNGSLLRMLILHDNEYAYCQRVADTLEVISRHLT